MYYPNGYEKYKLRLLGSVLFIRKVKVLNGETNEFEHFWEYLDHTDAYGAERWKKYPPNYTDVMFGMFI